MNSAQIKLGEVFSEKRGGDWGKAQPNNEYSEAVYCIRGADIENINSKYLDSLPVRYVKQSIVTSKSLTAKSIVIEISGGSPTQSTGRVARVDEEVISMLKYPVICTNFCRALLVKDEHNPEYIYYWLKNLYRNKVFFNFEGKTTGIKNLDLDAFLNSVEINLPANEVQDSVSKFIASIDRKISLNSNINAELQQMARLIYNYWFIQFDFPDFQGKPYKSSDGAMIYNEQLKREFPMQWGVSRLHEIEDRIITGKTPSTSNRDYYNGNVPFISIDDIRGNLFVVKTKKNLSESGAISQSTKFLPEGSICVTCIASPGIVGFVSRKSQTNQQINSIDCRNSENKYYLYFAIKDYFEYSAGAKSGNTFANMNKGDLESILIVNPDPELVAKYHDIVNPLFGKIHTNLKMNQELTELRDWLLPMLMHGQVKVG